MPNSDGDLPGTLDQLYAAVAALIDPRKELLDGLLHAAPSLYDELLSELPSQAGKGLSYRSSHYKTAAPLWLDALDLKTEIDKRVAAWNPKGDSTPERLRGHASRQWRPQDAKQLEQQAAELQSFALSITSMLTPQHVKHFSAPCPACGTRWVYRHQAGERIRQPALQLVAATGCTCQACRAFWAPQHYLLLAQVLGLNSPAGVLN